MPGYALASMHSSTSISRARLSEFRAKTYRTTATLRVKTQTEAVRFVNDRGFAYFWPIQGVEMPSLWVAVAGDRPVASAHDDPGHVTWGWKDALLGTGVWHYARVLRGKATLVAPEVVPIFYALSENFGEPREDAENLYRAGALSREAFRVLEILLDQGRQHTIALRREAGLTARNANTRFERALTELQMNWLIAPVAVAQAGAWRYAFVYDTVTRAWPGLVAAAGAITRSEARVRLLDLYLQSVGVGGLAGLQKLFRWTKPHLQTALETLVARGRIVPVEAFGDQKGPAWATLALVA